MNNILSDNWTLWFHNIDNQKYDLESYTKIFNFNSIEHFVILYRKIDNFSAGMFFLMKKNIPPLWENENNINGGYLSFKIYKKTINDIWFKLCSLVIGNTFLIQDNDDINGISLSPKINNCIIKIWFNQTKNYKDLIDEKVFKSLFKDISFLEESRFNKYNY